MYQLHTAEYRYNHMRALASFSIVTNRPVIRNELQQIEAVVQPHTRAVVGVASTHIHFTKSHNGGGKCKPTPENIFSPSTNFSSPSTKNYNHTHVHLKISYVWGGCAFPTPLPTPHPHPNPYGGYSPPTRFHMGWYQPTIFCPLLPHIWRGIFIYVHIVRAK